MTMYLSNFKIRGFQSFRTTQEVRLEQNLTILAGRNNVGKTALLKGLRYLQEEVPGADTSFLIEYTWTLSYKELMGPLDSASADLLKQYAGRRDAYQLQASFQPTPRADDLSYSFKTSWGLQCQFGNMSLIEAGIAGVQFGIGRNASLSPTQPAWWWKDCGLENDTRPESQAILHHFWRLISSQIGGALYIQPRRAGSQAKPVGVSLTLDADGSNLTTVVDTLYHNYRFSLFAQLEQFMRSAFPEITRIDTLMTQPNLSAPPLAEIQIVYGSARELAVPLTHCGTGIEQMLMLATAIFTATSSRLFLIDEPHAFLHPSAERSLLRLIRDHPEHQYVVATHSQVFLNAVALAQNRLITIDGEGSHVTDVKNVANILDEIGLTAADLGITDALLWIEGPSDAEAAEEVIGHFPELQQITWRVRPMPDWIRFTASTVDKAKQMMRFCDELQQDILPIRIPSFFVFDSDEKSESLKEQFKTETNGRVRLLPVREIENLFLCPEAIHAVLSNLCSQFQKKPPTVQEVREQIRTLLAETSDKKFYNYKTPPTRPDAAIVIGSHILEKLWWDFASSQYDKAVYARILTKEVCKHQPEKLEPLHALLSDLTELARQTPRSQSVSS